MSHSDSAETYAAQWGKLISKSRNTHTSESAQEDLPQQAQHTNEHGGLTALQLEYLQARLAERRRERSMQSPGQPDQEQAAAREDAINSSPSGSRQRRFVWNKTLGLQPAVKQRSIFRVKKNTDLRSGLSPDRSRWSHLLARSYGFLDSQSNPQAAQHEQNVSPQPDGGIRVARSSPQYRGHVFAPLSRPRPVSSPSIISGRRLTEHSSLDRVPRPDTNGILPSSIDGSHEDDLNPFELHHSRPIANSTPIAYFSR